MPAPERKEHVRCLVSNKWISPADNARWCKELNGFVSERGQRVLDNAEKTGTIQTDSLLHAIWSDWWSEDNPQGGYVD
tara:strand:+ start:178 stop:411 length:234 start_codon:yes stop_codon:yes gene_type:complete